MQTIRTHIVPFMPKRMTPEVAARVAGVAMIAPSRHASFEFHVSEWLGVTPSGPDTEPEVMALAPLPVACVYGSEESDSLCPLLPASEVQTTCLRAGHHMDGDYAAIARAIAAIAPESSTQPP